MFQGVLTRLEPKGQKPKMDSPERRMPMISSPAGFPRPQHLGTCMQDGRPSTKKSRNVLRARETGSGVAKPVLKLSRPRDDGEREDHSQPEFIPEHGHRVSGMLVVTHMCGRTFWRHPL
jgi:hypothetical protein